MESNQESIEVRKSSRNTRLKSKVLLAANAAKKDAVQKGRRSIFKKTFTARSPLTSSNTCRSVDSLFYKDTYYQVGDIVSLMSEDDDIFYAQIRGLIQDSFCEKSAVITWLLPTTSSPDPTTGFDAATYTIGPEEDQPRRLSSMLFVQHAPSNYYHDKTNPYPPPEVLQEGNRLSSYCGFIWTNLASKH